VLISASSNIVGVTRTVLVTTVILTVFAFSAIPADPAPDGQMTWALQFALSPAWFDPAETPGINTPYAVLYALHDAMVKPLPGHPMAPALAESWTAAPDGLLFEFVLRKGVKFHSGDPVTAEDVKFSIERYRGVASKILKERVALVETPDATRVRIRLKQPWPDFITFYAIATGAGWIVPKKYVEKVGEEAFKKAPIGAGPYRFVSFTPGVELVLEAFDQYWRKVPNVKRLVFKVVPDEATRLAMLKRGEVDIAYTLQGPLAEETRRTPGLTLKPAVGPTPFWIYFPEQWDPKSPWHDRRLRLAVNYALDRAGTNQSENLGYARITNSIIPASFEFYWQPPIYAHDPAKARQLLAEAGYPNGLDVGDFTTDAAFTNVAEAVANSLHAGGIRAKVRPLERAAFIKAISEKRLRNLIGAGSGAFGNAATRLEAFVVSTGAYAYGGYPDIDGLFREQAIELDHMRREAMLHRIQQLVHEKVMFAPIWQAASIAGVGPRVEESGIGLLTDHAFFSSPYEDVKLRGR
jgi:peptide/nickel transport system substrate-binding protein